ncbi:phage baseplate assembly protein [gamma proteobacterium HTCC5015]|nr:phage baseplate assembly protein [gamma proteobacterium HTCC5015]
MLNNPAELLRLLNNIVRTGTITEVDAQSAKARVKTGDNDTTWLPWLASRAATTAHWSPPQIGEQVVLLSPEGDLSQAIIITGLYSDANPAPSSNINAHRREFPDGTHVEYDHQAHTLTIDIRGDVSLVVTGNVDLIVDGDLTAEVGGSLLADVGDTAAITAGSTATVDAPLIEHNGGAGVVTGAHVCQFTGNPHSHCSTTVKAGQ